MATGKNTAVTRWTKSRKEVSQVFPQLSAWWEQIDDFRELRIKARDDGSIIVIAKGYGPDGGPVVAFGTGHDVIFALMSIEGTISAGHWRFDKPWTAPKG